MDPLTISLILSAVSVLSGGVIAGASAGLFGNKAQNAADNNLGLDSDTGQPVWKTQMKNNAFEASKQRIFEFMENELAYQRSRPVNQMNEYRLAGRNPSLMYGQMTDLSTQVPSGAEGSYSGSPTSGLNQLLGLGADITSKIPSIAADVELKQAQAAEIRSRIPLNDERRYNLSLQSRNIALEGKILGLDLKKYQDTIQSTIDSVNMTNEASKEQSRFTVDELNVKRKYLEDSYSDQLRELREKANEAAAHAREASVKADVAVSEKNLINKKVEQLDKLFEQYDQILERMKKDNSWYTADKIMGYINDLGNTTANIISAVGTLTNVAGNNPSFNNSTTERSRYVNENIFPGLED